MQGPSARLHSLDPAGVDMVLTEGWASRTRRNAQIHSLIWNSAVDGTSGINNIQITASHHPGARPLEIHHWVSNRTPNFGPQPFLAAVTDTHHFYLMNRQALLGTSGSLVAFLCPVSSRRPLITCSTPGHTHANQVPRYLMDPSILGVTLMQPPRYCSHRFHGGQFGPGI